MPSEYQYRQFQIRLAEPFTAPERGRYEAVLDDGVWRITPASDDYSGFTLDAGAQVTGLTQHVDRLEIVSTGRPDGALVLDVPMYEGNNDTRATTVRGYLIELLDVAMDLKSPFGNSDWQYDLYEAIARAGLVPARFDDDGDIDWLKFDKDQAHRLVLDAVAALGTPGR